MVRVLLICLLLYLITDTVYAMVPVPEDSASDLPKPEVKVTTGDVSNSVQIKDSKINIPNEVATGLTNLDSGAAVAAGLKGGASIAKGLPPVARLGILIAEGVSGGVIVAGANAANSLIQKKMDSSVVAPSSGSNSNTGGPAAFSVEPSADIDTVMTLLNSNLILHFCILYLMWGLLVIYLADKVIENKWNLMFIKNIFGERIHSFVMKSFTYASKSNKIWLMLVFILLFSSSLGSLFFSYFILNNLDIISEIVQQSKGK